MSIPPKFRLLTTEINDALIDYLHNQKVLTPGESVRKVEKFSGGNMNFVVRITTNIKIFVLKQARPWVEKYPQVTAPIERMLVEANFYKKIHTHTLLSSFMPQLIAADFENFTLLIEDCGDCADYSYLYKEQKQLSIHETKFLMTFLNQLHSAPFDDALDNIEMKKLNHEHIFSFPFLEDNGFDLDTIMPGLQKSSLPYKTDTNLKKKCLDLGQIYLHGTSPTLLHGDFYPGSWLNTSKGIKIIDPEFGFIGRPEFELGVFLAHLYLTFHDKDFIDKTLEFYQPQGNFDGTLMGAFIGIEILRRIIGLAQLPIVMDLEQRESLLHFAKKKI